MIYKFLPNFIFSPLFGDRKKWGTKVDRDDLDFKLWLDSYLTFYQDNQKGRIGNIVNSYGFKIVRKVDFSNKAVLEVGPGIIQHTDYASYENVESYTIADINPDFLDISEQILSDSNVKAINRIVVDGIQIPLEDNSVDIILSFHQLEHVYELDDYLAELKRVLKPGGLLVGAVPSEGALAWGMGRYLTSRRYVKKNMKFDYDKVICWEHPNFVDKISLSLRSQFEIIESKKRPLSFLPMDFNLSWSFIFRKSE